MGERRSYRIANKMNMKTNRRVAGTLNTGLQFVKKMRVTRNSLEGRCCYQASQAGGDCRLVTKLSDNEHSNINEKNKTKKRPFVNLAKRSRTKILGDIHKVISPVICKTRSQLNNVLESRMRKMYIKQTNAQNERIIHEDSTTPIRTYNLRNKIAICKLKNTNKLRKSSRIANIMRIKMTNITSKSKKTVISKKNKLRIKLSRKDAPKKTKDLREEIMTINKHSVITEFELTMQSYAKLENARKEKREANLIRKQATECRVRRMQHDPPISIMSSTLKHNIAEANRIFQNDLSDRETSNYRAVQRLPEGLQPHASTSQRMHAMEGYRCRLREAVRQTSVNCEFAKPMDRNGPEYEHAFTDSYGYNPLKRAKGEYCGIDPATNYGCNYASMYPINM